ncbi:hypothetical protein [Rhizobium binxianense]|uniref:hypothetical protein n=1 Tax=Rhizobium binxianense TaxID=3024242 RepID=UPI00235E7043|nr:hypothetical protein [Rhizobium sp. MC62]MDC9808403.1 hypothetical protein [Rhizobium sp. MC62]
MMKPRFLGTVEINGQAVGVFTPPQEPDFIWVNIDELAAAISSDSATSKMLSKFARNVPFLKPLTMAVHGSRLVAIGPNQLAQGLCACIDQRNGYKVANPDEWNAGPLTLKFLVAAADAQEAYAPLSFAGMLTAFKLQGMAHE